MINRDRVLIFTLAVLVRGIVGWIFFGSVDVTNAMLNSARLFGGIPMTVVPIPYLPGIVHGFLWVSGVLAANTALPLTFCYRIFSTLFDGALAVLVHDALLPDRTRASAAGMLYALSPVSVIITAIHTQWDAISFALLLLAFLLVVKHSRVAQGIAGAAFVTSILVKPIVPVLLPLLFPAPWLAFRPEHRKRTWSVIAGMAATTVVYLVLLWASGEMIDLFAIDRIVHYAQEGAQLFGAPKLLAAPASRLYNLLSLLLLVPLYWKQYVTREEATLLFFCFIFATSGLCPQYLLWAIPFALICKRIRFAAIYTLVAGLLLMIYYQTPGPSKLNTENLGAFGPLLSMAWLAPAATFPAAKLFLFQFLGNVLLPLLALVYFVMSAMRIVRRREIVTEHECPLPASSIVMPVAIATSAVLAVAFVAWKFMAHPDFQQFGYVVYGRVPEYAIYRYTGPGLVNPNEPTWVIGAFAGHPPAARWIDAASIGYAWVLAWCTGAWMVVRRT